MSARQSSGRGYEYAAVAMLGITFGLVWLDRNAVNVLMPFIVKDLRFTATEVGLVGSVVSITWALAGYAAGHASDAMGRRKSLLLAAVVLFSLCSAGSGLATSFAALLLARLLMGLAEGPVPPLTIALGLDASAPHRRGANIGMISLLANLMGFVVAPIALVALANRVDWRNAFFVSAVPGLVAAMVLARFLRESRPAQVPGVVVAERPVLRGGLELFRIRNVWVCALTSTFLVAWGVIGAVFLPLFYVQVRGFSAAEMSTLVSIGGVSILIGTFALPAISDRLGRKPVLAAFALLGVLAPLANLYWSGSVFMLGALVLIGNFTAALPPLVIGIIPGESAPAAVRGSVLGLVMGTAELLGGFASPTLTGWAVDHTNLNTPLIIQVGCALAVFGFAQLLKETAPAKSRSRTPHPPQ